MLKDGPFARVFIRTTIAFIRLVTPACLAYLSARVITAHTTSLSTRHPRAWRWLIVLDVYASLEAGFFLLVYLPRRWYLNQPTRRSNPLPTPEERKAAFEKTWEATRNPKGYLSLWFKDVDVEGLHYDDVKDWMHWRLWNGTERYEEHEDELDEYVQHIERLLDLRFPPGRGEYKSMMVTTEPLRMAHRPLMWYQFIVAAVDLQLFTQMWLSGYRYVAPALSWSPRAFPFRPLALFRRHRSPAQHLSYFCKPHLAKDCLPVLFIHGIGVGLGFYLPFLSQFVAEYPEIGIVSLELLPISNRITHAPLRPEVMVQEVKQILEHHGWERVVLVTHSYGSVVAAQLLHSPLTAPLLGPLLFVDPVTFSFHPPEVAWNFLRRKPTTASEHQLQYFASLDPGVAQALTRSFVWTDNSLWREDVEQREGRCTVALSGRDIITDTDTLGAYLTRSETSSIPWYEEPEELQNDDWKRSKWTGRRQLEVVHFPELNHSEPFDEKHDRDRLFEVIDVYTKESSANQT